MTTLNIYNASAPPVATTLTPNSPPSPGMTFGDILDAVNPLQHIPVLSNMYRAATGTSISAGSQIAGDTLFGAIVGGPILAGAALAFSASTTDVAVKATTGQGIAGHLLSALGVGNASSTTSNPTALVPDPNAVPNAATAATSTAQNATIEAQAQTAAQLIAHQGLNPGQSNTQYQKAQMHDAVNKYLVKMAI